MSDNQTVEVIEVNSLDGEGLPYFDQPEGVYTPATEEEDDLEMLRR